MRGRPFQFAESGNLIMVTYGLWVSVPSAVLSCANKNFSEPLLPEHFPEFWTPAPECKE